MLHSSWHDSKAFRLVLDTIGVDVVATGPKVSFGVRFNLIIIDNITVVNVINNSIVNNLFSYLIISSGLITSL